MGRTACTEPQCLVQGCALLTFGETDLTASNTAAHGTVIGTTKKSIHIRQPSQLLVSGVTQETSPHTAVNLCFSPDTWLTYGGPNAPHVFKLQGKQGRQFNYKINWKRFRVTIFCHG